MANLFSQGNKNMGYYIIQPGPEEGFDTEVYSCSEFYYDTMNFGDRPELTAIAWTRSGVPSNVRSLIYFNMPTISSALIIDSAFLKLYASPNSLEGQHWSLSGPNTTVLRMVTSPWQEHVVTWLTQPTTTTNNQVLLPQTSSVTENFKINITSFVSQWIANPSTNFGMEFLLQDETYYRKVVFASSDHTIDSIRPKLEIYYSQGNFIAGNAEIQSKLYPNPVNRGDDLILELNNQSKKLVVDIIDIAGKLLFSKEFNDVSSIKIPTDFLSNGVYTLRLLNETGSISSKKFIVI